MAIVINGSGTVTGLAVGGLPDGTVDEGTLATDSVTAAKIPAALENTFVSGRKNLIINGDMRVQQRGTASVTSGYFVDRFTLGSCSASAVLTSSTPTEFPTAISVSATSGNPVITQRIESKNCQGLSGQTVTASFYAKNISNATTLYAKLQYAGGADSWGSSTTISEQNLGTLSGSWVKYTASWTVPAGGLNGLALGILCAGSSTFTMGVTGVQLEVGSTATDFEHRSYGEELTLCQRYFQRYQAEQQEWLYNEGNAAHGKWWQLVYSEMRAGPTVTFDSGWTGGASGGLSGTITAISASSNPYRLSARVTFSAAGGSAYNVHHTDSFNGSYCYLDAEL